jgi:uncharacterized protein
VKISLILASLVLAATLAPKVSAQTASGASPAAGALGAADAPVKIDAVKEADIRKLLAMTGAADLAKQLMDNMEANMRPLLLRSLPPGDYREKLLDLFIQRFQSKANPQHIVDMNVGIYDKYLSDQDVKGLIQFYSTPLGQKAIMVFPKLTTEAQTEGIKWGQEMGQEAMTEVLSEHPEFEKAIEDAQKGAGAH